MSNQAELTLDQIEYRVKKVISEQLAIDPERITNETSFENDLGADSLDKVEIIMAMEEEFDCDILDEDADRIKTIGQAVEYLHDRLCQK
ncbi:acyl carrier protein [Candidatus Igneacidithiobacillus taiwanensis]|uniref:acyl carrier protein n=1 Tax=Candidatus Igneacidithiobacillus taiwanensis TaxID=1945924 RepID=UPI002899D37C|nr:acyl carrier protein [Candidatus Igneacidithiobacillus taiwanensis]